MKLYMLGKVISKGKTYILFETNGIGHIVYVSIPDEFKVEANIKLFVYEYNSEYQHNIYGFRTFNERILFEDLISVSGVGPKTALSILQKDFETVSRLIAKGDAATLSNFKHMGSKTANQICVELSGKYQNMIGLKEGQSMPIEISSTLKTLGFSTKQIDYAIKNLKPSKNIDELIEKAITIISNAKRITA